MNERSKKRKQQWKERKRSAGEKKNYVYIIYTNSERKKKLNLHNDTYWSVFFVFALSLSFRLVSISLFPYDFCLLILLHSLSFSLSLTRSLASCDRVCAYECIRFGCWMRAIAKFVTANSCACVFIKCTWVNCCFFLCLLMSIFGMIDGTVQKAPYHTGRQYTQHHRVKRNRNRNERKNEWY